MIIQYLDKNIKASCRTKKFNLDQSEFKIMIVRLLSFLTGKFVADFMNYFRLHFGDHVGDIILVTIF